MSKIFELYGYRLDCWNDAAARNRAKAWCPFMDAECDGGGNRYLSAIDLKKAAILADTFRARTSFNPVFALFGFVRENSLGLSALVASYR